MYPDQMANAVMPGGRCLPPSAVVSIGPCRPLPGAIDQLEARIAVLDKAIEEAAARLGFVLQPEAPPMACGNVSPGSPRPPVSGAVLQVEALADRVQSLTRRVDGIMARLDV